ncbi:DEAD/DEAH box helicase family protein [Corynebacterium lizhenjunii]|uniref:DEAD/DEAH box helicase family protein n=1 Tax=Corynebacterium lizhenjunii TaxID=2709394 RepID=A0A7T0PB65_9CORY|nr:DEAD/DEAH box helicase family protein [Corynebacterium lizhenjunii]QPK79095.1 DEAD/DEAH box helicase family protein [Corynebacterium lizhenjunii]
MTTPTTPSGAPLGARSNFSFLHYVWPVALRECVQAERGVDAAPVVSCILARKVLERVVHHIWAFRELGQSQGEPLAGLMADRDFQATVADRNILNKMHIVRKRGNDAAHATELEGGREVLGPKTARQVVMHLYDVLVWAVAKHSANPHLAPGPNQAFRQELLGAGGAGGTGNPGQSQTEIAQHVRELKRQQEQLKAQRLMLDDAQQRAKDEREQHLREVAAFEEQRRRVEQEQAGRLADAEARAEEERQAREELNAQLAKLQEQLAKEQAKKAVDAGQPTAPLAISEEETRRQLIDPLLADAGFVGDGISRELELRGMPSASGVGYADYVLWDDDRRPLAVIEAKKALESMAAGAQQVKLYADCMEKQFGQRPIMFVTNGYHIDLIDDAAHLPRSGAGYPAREVEGFPTARQLRRMIRRRSQRADLTTTQVDADIAGGHGRDYQRAAIQAVAESLQDKRHRQALLVMATGTGKTRVAVATAKLLREAGWVGKVLFLADRTALVKQAHRAFVNLYPQAAPVNVLESPTQVGDVYVSTYNTMMNLIGDDGTSPATFRPFDFDLIIVDEAHRSVYNRFGRILDYFDAYVVGLTATPKSDIEHDTYALFGLDDKTPTFAYEFPQAVDEGHLVPYKTVLQGTKFLDQGMHYAQLTPEEQLEWDAAEWGTDEDGQRLDPPGDVSSADINRVLYNRDTIRHVLKTVVERGIRVGGDQLGKTIIFARSQRHAELIKEVFDAGFPEYSLEGASVITNRTKYAQSALDEFARPDGPVNIAISVDMLDTGVDVPEVVNLVFFKPVYSRTKYWQMVGRGTRLRPDLFGPGMDKEHFLIFDFCGNVQRFGTPQEEETLVRRPRSLSEKLFVARVELLAQLAAGQEGSALRTQLADALHSATAAVPPGHIMVRPEDKETLLRYGHRQAWEQLTAEDVAKLEGHVAHLPLGTMKESESAKRFDLLIVQLQLGVCAWPDVSADVPLLRERVVKIADDLLAVSDNLPVVAERRSFLERVLKPEWWEEVTVDELEAVRKGMRDLVQFIPKGSRNVVILDIADEAGEVVVDEAPSLAGAGSGSYPSLVERRLRELLAKHEDDIALQKLRRARELTNDDIAALEAMVAEAGNGEPGYAEGVDKLRASMGDVTIPAFIRRLVGLDKDAMKEKFQDLLENNNFNAVQIRFLNLLVDGLAQNGGLKFNEIFERPYDVEGNVIDIFKGSLDVVTDIRKRLEDIDNTA